MTYVALLRGVNVVGKNKLPMKELAKVLLNSGCGNVRTYIQSGNVVFRAEGSGPPCDWETAISTAIETAFSLKVPVVLRSVSEMSSLVLRNPFVAQGAAVEHLHVVFLSDVLPRGVLDPTDQERFSPDTFRAERRELYLWVPTGFGTSKLPAYLERKLKGAGLISTTRNWRTTLQLASMAKELPPA